MTLEPAEGPKGTKSTTPSVGEEADELVAEVDRFPVAGARLNLQAVAESLDAPIVSRLAEVDTNAGTDPAFVRLPSQSEAKRAKAAGGKVPVLPAAALVAGAVFFIRG